jgi:predicted dehydrogenase
MDATFTFQLAAVKHALASGDALPTEGEDMIANMETIDAIYRAGGFVRG